MLNIINFRKPLKSHVMTAQEITQSHREIVAQRIAERLKIQHELEQAEIDLMRLKIKAMMV